MKLSELSLAILVALVASHTVQQAHAVDGACCVDNECIEIDEGSCVEEAEGEYLGDGTTGTPNPCLEEITISVQSSYSVNTSGSCDIGGNPTNLNITAHGSPRAEGGATVTGAGTSAILSFDLGLPPGQSLTFEIRDGTNMLLDTVIVNNIQGFFSGELTITGQTIPGGVFEISGPSFSFDTNGDNIPDTSTGPWRIRAADSAPVQIVGFSIPVADFLNSGITISIDFNVDTKLQFDDLQCELLGSTSFATTASASGVIVPVVSTLGMLFLVAALMICLARKWPRAVAKSAE